MLDLKLNFLKNHLENVLLNINSNDSAHSVSCAFNSENISIDVIQNNHDSENVVISAFIKALTDYCLMHDIKYTYHVSVSFTIECTEINFFVVKK